MNFTFAHNNLNVYDLDASLRFYKEALGLTVTRTKEADDGSFKLVYLGDSTTPHKLELTWLRDMEITRSILHLKPMILMRHTKNTKRWNASVLRIRGWGFISFPILTDIGWRSYLKIYNIKKGSFL